MNSSNDFFSAQFVTRLIIVSYFVAVALNIIPGIEIARLANPFMPDIYAHYTMRTIVLTLSGMVLFGVWRRAAALVLALVVFWTSYITLYSGGELGAFWRDLALIGALLLAANIAAYADRATDESWEDDEHADVEDALGKDVRKDALEGGDGQFREDFDIVRAI